LFFHLYIYVYLLHQRCKESSRLASREERIKDFSKGKGKAILLPAWTGPESSRRLRLPGFKTFGT